MEPVDSNSPSRLIHFERWIERHKVGLTALGATVATATVCTKLRLANHETMIQFIKEKDLMDEFVEYAPIVTK